MNNELLQEINKNNFFSDFLLFLNTLKEKGEFQPTLKGNLQRKEIDYFGKAFKVDIYHRDREGNIMWPIYREDEVPHLKRMRLMCKVMYITYQRTGRLLLSKNGKGYLTNIEKQTQYEQMILWYFHRCNWGYMHYYLDDLAELFQNEQHILWRQLLSQKDNWIDFKTYIEGIRLYFHLNDKGEFSDRVEWAVERVIVKDLELYGLIETKSVLGEYKKTIQSLKLTKLGEHMLTKFLTEPF